MEWLRILGVIKKFGPFPAFVLLAGSGICLFAPDSFIARLGLVEFRNAQRHYFGVAFLVSFLYLLGHTIAWAAKWFGKWRRAKEEEASRLKQLQKLNRYERAFLRRFCVTDGQSQHADPSDGIAGGLLLKGIIYRATDIFEITQGVPYNVQPWAWELITSNPSLVGTDEELKETAQEIKAENEQTNRHGW